MSAFFNCQRNIIKFCIHSRSSILSNTSAPQWDDEEWIVRNIPRRAKLSVVIFDKDDQKLTDDYIGQFEVIDLIDYRAPIDGHKIVDLHGQYRGQFIFDNLIRAIVERIQTTSRIYIRWSLSMFSS